MCHNPERLEWLRRKLRRDDVAALMVTSEANVCYLTGFTGEASVLLVAEDREILISDGRFTTQLREECPDLAVHIRPVGQPLFEGVGEVVAKFGAGRVGYEPGALSVAAFEKVKAKADAIEWRGVPGRVERLRAVKDPGEVEEIRRAIDQAERAFAMLRAGIEPEDSEKGLADTLEANLRRCGASAAAFAPIVAVGPRSALPHARPTREAKVRDADFLLVDWGAVHGAYRSDLTRVLVTGKFTPEFEAVYRAVLAAQEAGIAALRPGVRAEDVDASARSVIEAAGFGDHFTHGLGHGIGLEIHENPFFRRHNPARLRAGMVVTIEPGIYLPGRGGVRIEDDVLITPDGPEVLSRIPKSLEATLLR